MTYKFILSAVLFVFLTGTSLEPFAAEWEASFDLGDEMMKAGEYEQAIVEYETALELATETRRRVIILYKLGTAKRAAGDYDDALLVLGEAQKILESLGKNSPGLLVAIIDGRIKTLADAERTEEARQLNDELMALISFLSDAL